MKKHLLFVLVIALLLSACQSATTPTAQPTEAVAAEPSAAPVDTAETILITDAQGREVQVPANPQRIVALSEQDMDAAVALGMPLVGVVNGRGSGNPPVYLQDKLGEAVSVGSFNEPSLEKILELKPDLILIGGVFPGIAGLIEPLSQIAPTVVTYKLEDPWNEAFLKSAAAMNRQAEAQTWLDEVYGVRITELKAKLGDQATSSVGIVRFNPDGPVIMALDSFSSRVARDLGLVRPETQQIEGYAHSETINLEQLNLIDADSLFVASLNPDGQAVLEAALKDPLYQSLSAVAGGKTFVVDGAIWASRGGPLAALEVLADIEKPLAAGGQASAFPVTIAHKYGSTTLTEKPERIVLVGLTEQDALLALGVVPVATREWWGERPGAIFEWATDKLDDAPLPEVLPANELNFEQIAALNPDVIVGLYAGLTQEEYDTLSKIAPTIAQPAEYPDWGIPWQELTYEIGLIVGKAPQAEKLIADLEAKFAAARQAHPEFAGKTGIVASAWGYPDSYWVYTSKDVRSQFLLNLGFQSSSAFDEAIGNEFGAAISREKVEMLNDLDLAVWFADNNELSDPLYQQLAVSQEGRNILIASTDPLAFAYSFNTVLNLPYVLDKLVPQLAAAVDGDPATVYSE